MEIREVLRQANFRYNKALGQNFITDKNLLSAIVQDAGVTKEHTVVEIGTGAGTLTRVLSEAAKRVITFEVDSNLLPVLQITLENLTNVELQMRDVLSMSDAEIMEIAGTPFQVVANLPYYITTPLMMRFLESGLPVTSLTLMMQKEVADRMVARHGTPEYGAVTVAVDLKCDAKITRVISRQNFYPVPKVDSALLRLDVREDKYAIREEAVLKKLVKAAFLWRRKTLVNNLIAFFSLPRERCERLLKEAGFDPMIRGEKLSSADFILLSEGVAAELSLQGHRKNTEN